MSAVAVAVVAVVSLVRPAARFIIAAAHDRGRVAYFVKIVVASPRPVLAGVRFEEVQSKRDREDAVVLSPSNLPLLSLISI